MMEKLHTPEPWKAWSHYGDWTIEARSPSSGFMVDIAHASFSEPDARRIVACVNALEGIPTEILEMAGTGLMSDAAVEVGKLTAQRDELLAALKECKSFIGELPKSQTPYGLFRKLQSIIARSKNA